MLGDCMNFFPHVLRVNLTLFGRFRPCSVGSREVNFCHFSLNTYGRLIIVIFDCHVGVCLPLLHFKVLHDRCSQLYVALSLYSLIIDYLLGKSIQILIFPCQVYFKYGINVIVTCCLSPVTRRNAQV